MAPVLGAVAAGGALVEDAPRRPATARPPGRARARRRPRERRTAGRARASVRCGVERAVARARGRAARARCRPRRPRAPSALGALDHAEPQDRSPAAPTGTRRRPPSRTSAGRHAPSARQRGGAPRRGRRRSPRNCSVRCHWSRRRPARAGARAARRTRLDASHRRREHGVGRAHRDERARHGLTASASSRCRSRLSSEIVENWRIRSRSPGSRVADRLGRSCRAARSPKHTVPTGCAVLLGRARRRR